MSSPSCFVPSTPRFEIFQLKKSKSLEKIELVNVGGTEKLFSSIGESLGKNPTTPLTSINFSEGK